MCGDPAPGKTLHHPSPHVTWALWQRSGRTSAGLGAHTGQGSDGPGPKKTNKKTAQSDTPGDERNAPQFGGRFCCRCSRY